MQIIEDSLLKYKTTMRLGGHAYQELIIDAYHDADIVLQHIEKEGLPVFILGGGSNLLIDSEPLDACILRSTYTCPMTILRETEEDIHIQAPLSIPLQRFVIQAMKYGAQGFEGLAGVPGTLGGAIAMNAGSFGSEITRHLYSLDILSLQDGILHCTQEDFTIQYRSFSPTRFNIPYIGLSAIFVCPKGNPELLRSFFSHNMTLKKQRQPLNVYSAGCVFKNTECGSTGKLLEEVGMKAIATEHFHFSEHHANFLVHDGNGTLDEALSLIQQAQERIRQQYSISLELEVRIWTTRNI